MKRTLYFLAGLLVLFVAFDFLSRDVLHIDCIGPVLPAWGCLAEPYPTTIGAMGDGGRSLLVYGGLVVGVVALAWMLKWLTGDIATLVLRRVRPDWLQRYEEEPPSYRIR
jgi:hypothetical protein